MIKYLPLILLIGCTSSEPLTSSVPPEEVISPQPVVTIPINLVEPVAQPVVQPIVAPIEEEIPEILVVAPANPLVFYTVEQDWMVPVTGRPMPVLLFTARLQFDESGAESYNIIHNEETVKVITNPSTDPYTFTFTKHGELQYVDFETFNFPVVQVQAAIQSETALSNEAEWVME